MVDFHLSYEGIHIPGRKEQYLPIPIEYKHGDVKRDHSDEAQLCAQAICLEEMLSTDIPFGYLYYRKTRHREKVPLTEGLRNFVFKMAGEMHAYYDRSYTPQVRPTKACQNCSLKEICLPGMLGNVITASKYIQMQINGE
ncbi:CRISPR-associated exonuclease Cas4 [Pelolinea submarina]|nr:CRISPR-associated exonuclease Cas4 [Pelolinea submarina]